MNDIHQRQSRRPVAKLQVSRINITLAFGYARPPVELKCLPAACYLLSTFVLFNDAFMAALVSFASFRHPQGQRKSYRLCLTSNGHS